MLWRRVVLIGLISVTLRAPAEQSQTQPVEPCFRYHGRLSSQNGIALTIWLIGTTRIVALDNDAEELPSFLRKYTNMTSPDHSYIYGDFDICPMELDKPGHMRRVRVVGAEKLVVQDVQALRPAFRLLSSWQRRPADQSPVAILEAAALDVRGSEPSWQFGRSVCNLPPLMDEEEGLSCGSWMVGSDRGIKVFAAVHQITDAETVSRWMTSSAARPTAGWVKGPYELSVVAYFATHQSTSDVEIVFGKGRFIVTVNGRSRVDVDRVARALLRQIT
jgi:hypothetical protein